MTKLSFLVTLELPAELPADRQELIRGEVEQHAAACVEFYGRVKPAKVEAHSISPGLSIEELIP